MIDWLRVDYALFTVLDYPMSAIEFVGTILYLWSVWLIAQRHVLTWPVGIIAVLLYMIMFWQINLYSDAIEQVYYLGASVYGWWYWARSPKVDDAVTGVHFSDARLTILVLFGTAAASALWGAAMTRIHLSLPSLFPEPASYPWLDAATTVMSFTAMALMTFKRTESWVYWIVVDILGIWLYYVKGVRFTSLLYVILLVLAFRGLQLWVAASRNAAMHGRTDTDGPSGAPHVG